MLAAIMPLSAFKREKRGDGQVINIAEIFHWKRCQSDGEERAEYEHDDRAGPQQERRNTSSN